MPEEANKLTGLRDVRKPCHFWVDNEVADVYQPIVGADAIWVYCRIARNAHGAWIVSPKRRDGDTRVSLREMAEWCGKSVDTVWRCLQILEHVGLLQSLRGTKSSGRYALTDVKDLVTREGGEYDRTMASFQLPPARVARLKAEVKELRAKLARKASGLEIVGGAASAQSVALSDRLEGTLFSASGEKCDRSVARSDKTVALDAQPSIKQESKQARPSTPLLSPQAGTLGLGTADQADEEPPLTPEQLAHLAKHANDAKWVAQWEGYYREANRAAAREAAKAAEEARAGEQLAAERRAQLGTVPAARAYVMRQCRFTPSRRGRGIERVIDDVLEQGLEIGEPLWETAPRMAEAWECFQANLEFIDVKWGPVNFYRLGIWKNKRGWAWNETKLERSRGARVGVV